MTPTFLAFILAMLAPGELLVSAEDLAARIAAEDAPIIVDVREERDYLAGHIPGARHLDYRALSEDRDGVSGLLKDEAGLAAVLAAAGIDPEAEIVIYSGMARPEDLKHATRVFWILEYLSYPRVRLLDGGLRAWRAADAPLERGEADHAPLAVEHVADRIEPRPELLATSEEVEALRQSGEGHLIDMRTPEQFSGEEKSDMVDKAGHIPGAQLMPDTQFVRRPEYLLLGLEELQALLPRPKGALTSGVVTYCNSGREATVGYFLYRRAGYGSVAVYDGSMSQWAAEDRPVSSHFTH